MHTGQGVVMDALSTTTHHALHSPGHRRRCRHSRIVVSNQATLRGRHFFQCFIPLSGKWPPVVAASGRGAQSGRDNSSSQRQRLDRGNLCERQRSSSKVQQLLWCLVSMITTRVSIIATAERRSSPGGVSYLIATVCRATTIDMCAHTQR